MDISASMEEIRVYKPDVSRGALIRPGLSVGQSVLGTMTTTLMLAYSGSYLSMLMYFVGQNTLVTFTESVWSVGSVGRAHRSHRWGHWFESSKHHLSLIHISEPTRPY